MKKLILSLILGSIYFSITVFVMAVAVEANTNPSPLIRPEVSDSSASTFVSTIFCSLPIILGFIIFRYLKLLFEFFYFSACVAITLFIGIGYDGGPRTYGDLTIEQGGVPFFIGQHMMELVLCIFLPYIIIYFLNRDKR